MNERCEETGKASFSSKRAALNSLVGQLGTKRVRVYPCSFHPGHYHLTKESNNKLSSPNARKNKQWK